MFLVPFALTGKTTASCLLSLFLISELFPKQDTPHQPFGISSISVVMSSCRQFVLTAKCAEAKSRELVIWAPTVVMRHLQCNRPNQIFGCASSDATSHIVTVVLAGGAELELEERHPGRWGRGRRALAAAPSSCDAPALCQSQPPSKAAAPLGRGPNLHKAKEECGKARFP